MSRTSERLLREIFVEAAEIVDAEERAAFLDAACRDNESLRRRVDHLFTLEASKGPSPEIRPAIPEPSPGTRIGAYRIQERLGEGGFGIVYAAEQEEPVRRQVALKIIKLGMDTEHVIARFEAERQALAMMDHPGIAKVFDAGATETGRPFFAMERVRGTPITNYCADQKLGIRERLELFLQVCRAVQHAHQKGIIHRDLKPSNVLVTEHEGLAQPKIIDFGIAKATEGRLTEATLFTAFEQLIGTPSYMSPEQAAMVSDDVDTRSDIYSLGVLLYELLTGTTPFDSRTLLRAGVDEMRRTIREIDPERPSTRIRQSTATSGKNSATKISHASLSSDLDWIVMKCLEKDPNRRYEAALGLAGDVQHHLDDEPVTAHPPSRLYRMQKAVRRSKVAFATTAAILLVLAVGLAGVLWQWRRAMTAEEQALRDRDRALSAEHQAERNLAEITLEKAQSKLEDGDRRGLFDLVEAYRLADQDPDFQEVIARRWATWNAEWESRTIAIIPNRGMPSPDYLSFATLIDWAPLNQSSTIHLLDTVTGEELTHPLEHESVVTANCFSPDGRLLATVTERGTIHLWNRRNGQPVRAPCETGIRNLNEVEISPDGRFLIAHTDPAKSSSESGLESQGSSHWAFLPLGDINAPLRIEEHEGVTISKVRFSPDGEVLAVMGSDILQLWQTKDLQRLAPSVHVTNSSLLEFTPDGSRLACHPVGVAGMALLDPYTGQSVQRFPMGTRDLDECAFSPDGSLVAGFCWDTTLLLWRSDAPEKPYATFDVRFRAADRPSFHPDGSLLALGDSSGRVHVLRGKDGQVVHTLQLRHAPRAQFLSNGLLATKDWGECLFWDLEATLFLEVALPHDAMAYSLAFDPSGEFLAVGGEGELRIWRMGATPLLEHVVAIEGSVTSVTFAASMDRFVAFSETGVLRSVDSQSGETQLIRQIDFGRERIALLSPDARRLSLAPLFAGQGPGMVVDPSTGEADRFSAHEMILSTDFRSDSRRLAVGTAGWAIHLFDTARKPPAPRLQAGNLRGWIEGLAYHPGGKLLAANVGERVIQIYDAESLTPLFNPYEPALAAVKRLQFSPDGSLLLTGGLREEGEYQYGIEIWHVDPVRGLERATTVLPCGEVPDPRVLFYDRNWASRCMAISPDNRTLVVGGQGSTRCWLLPAPPADLEEIQTRTEKTLGMRIDEEGNQVRAPRPIEDVDRLRERLTSERPSFRTAIDAALQQPPSEAVAALESLASQHPANGVYRKLLGKQHQALMHARGNAGQWKMAQEHAAEAIRLGYDKPPIQFRHALLCLKNRDVEGYRKRYRTMMERYANTSDPHALRWLAGAIGLHPHPLENFEDLLPRMEHSMSLEGEAWSPIMRFYVGVLLARTGQYDEASAVFEGVQRHLDESGMQPNFPVLANTLLLAICQAKLGNANEARERIEAATVRMRNSGGNPWHVNLILELLHAEAEAAVAALAPQDP